MSIMLTELIVAGVMVILTVILHGIGLALLERILRDEAHDERVQHLGALSLRAMMFKLVAVVGLFALHGVEIWGYAFIYLFVGAVRGLETSVYFSTISYTAIGYSDHYILPSWRLLAGIEGINGVLLLGWSTAFFVTLIVRLGR